MSGEIRIDTSDIRDAVKDLCAGQRVLLSGTVYTARDAAHRELFSLLDRGEGLPFELEGAVVYYAGPTPAPPGMVTGSCGPTTSARMDSFTPRLLSLGLSAMIGKGERSAEVARAVVESSAVYFAAIGGAGALISRHITRLEEIAFPELGCESIKRLNVDRLPLYVALDCRGGSIFASARV